MLTIIDDLLDISKLDADKLEIESIPFVVDDVVGQSMSLMRSRADEKGLAFNSVIDPQIPGVVIGDPHRLRQIILNLIGNAIKFTDRGSVTVEAKIESQTDNMVALSLIVSDTGKGIDPEALEKLFSAYTQGSAAVAQKYGGTGLGLAICRRLTILMDGKITVESTLNKGSAFQVTINFKIDKVTDAVSLRKYHIAGQPSIANAQAVCKLRVLQVEDNETNRTIIERILGRVGHSVNSVENGELALEALKSGDFDVVLMDHHMPLMDGLQTTRRIRDMDGPVASIPIIGITASASHDELQMCKDVGMDDCLSKPVEAARLRTLLESLVSGNKSYPPASNPAIEANGHVAMDTEPPLILDNYP